MTTDTQQTQRSGFTYNIPPSLPPFCFVSRQIQIQKQISAKKCKFKCDSFWTSTAGIEAYHNLFDSMVQTIFSFTGLKYLHNLNRLYKRDYTISKGYIKDKAGYL